MTRPTLHLDIAFLERRLWLSQLATQRRCTLEQAEAWAYSDRHWKRLAQCIGVGIVFTLCLILWGMP